MVYIFRLIDEAWRLLLELGNEIAISDIELMVLEENPQVRAVTNANSAWMRHDLNELKSYLESMREKGLLGEAKATLMSEFTNKADALDSELAKVEGSIFEAASVIATFRIKSLKIKGKRELVGYLTHRILFLSVAGGLVMIIGIALASIGFKRWQVVQNDIDSAIHNQVESSKK